MIDCWPNIAYRLTKKGARQGGFGMYLPTAVGFGQDSAGKILQVIDAVAIHDARKDSALMAVADPSVAACNRLFRYPSPCRRFDDVPFKPSALSCLVTPRPAQSLAETQVSAVGRFRNWPVVRCLSKSSNSREGLFSWKNLGQSSSFARHRLACRPAVIQRLSRVSWARVPVPAQPLSRAETQKQQRSLAASSMWPIARPIPGAATKTYPVAIKRPINISSTGARRTGGFFVADTQGFALEPRTRRDISCSTRS